MTGKAKRGSRSVVATAGKARLREEALRPSRCLGYDHDSLGMHLVSIGCFDLAQAELERAVWLNPFEPRFVFHLAWCSYRAGRLDEAQQRIAQLRERGLPNARYDELERLVNSARSTSRAEAQRRSRTGGI